MEKENTTDESDCSENEIPGLVSLKPFEFERKTNIGDMNSSQTHSPQVFYKKAILKNFVTFTGKRLCWSLFLIKLQAFRPETLLKRDSNTSVFL